MLSIPNRARIYALSLTCLSTFSAAELAAQLNWVRARPTAKPDALSDLAMVYDAARERCVLYGGWNGQNDVADTWEYDGTTWTKRSHRTSPGPNSTHRMVYDAARGNVMMFGGYCGRGCARGKTWTWNGTDWTEHQPQVAPAARYAHAMAYDSVRKRTVLFGGTDGAGGVFGDTWEWDGARWTRLAIPGPSARFSAAMAFDAHRGRIVMHGGSDGAARMDETWTFDGLRWQRLAPAVTPGARTGHGMVFDSLRSRCVIFGGFTGVQHSAEVWDWDGAEWRRRSTATVAAARSFMALAFDARRNRTVLFGGGTAATLFKDNLWLQPDHPASAAPFGQGCGVLAGVPRLEVDPVALAWRGASVRLRVVDPSRSASMAVFGIGLSTTQWAGLQLPYDLTPMGLAGCSVLAAFDTSHARPMNRSGVATFELAIPNQASLLGAWFVSQAVTGSGANAYGLSFSNGLRNVIGGR